MKTRELTSALAALCLLSAGVARASSLTLTSTSTACLSTGSTTISCSNGTPSAGGLSSSASAAGSAFGDSFTASSWTSITGSYNWFSGSMEIARTASFIALDAYGHPLGTGGVYVQDQVSDAATTGVSWAIDDTFVLGPGLAGTAPLTVTLDLQSQCQCDGDAGLGGGFNEQFAILDQTTGYVAVYTTGWAGGGGGTYQLAEGHTYEFLGQYNINGGANSVPLENTRPELTANHDSIYTFSGNLYIDSPAEIISGSGTDYSQPNAPSVPEPGGALLAFTGIAIISAGGRTLTRRRTALLACFSFSALLQAGTITGTDTVNATDDIYGAGQASPPNGAGTLPSAISLASFEDYVVFTGVTGSITINGGANYNDADGTGSEHSSSSADSCCGLSGIIAPDDGYLTGVFVDGAPSGAPPATLDFTAGGNVGTTAFTALSPALDQVFFIGDGLTGNGTGTTQQFNIPGGATALYLGISDYCASNGPPGCYNDNSGAFAVTYSLDVAASPEPRSFILLLSATPVTGFFFRRRARRSQHS